MPDPNSYENEDDFMKVCVPKMLEEGKGQDQAVAACMSMWKERGKSEEKEMQTDFLFVELSTSLDELKMIDGLAAGKFTAMSGQEVEFKSDELPDYIANTRAIIESTRTEKGEVVGLPIDKNGHDHHGGAGWIVDLELDAARNVIRFVVKWTKDGIDLIKGNIRRFFSPSTDPSEKVILGGSLTNWPATRDRQGKMLLRPVELSQSMKEIDMEKTLEELQAENVALAAQVATLEAAKPAPVDDNSDVKELGEWMEGNQEGVEELSRRAQEQAELIIRTERRKDKAVEFASRIVGGTKDKPFGLPVKTSRIVKLLLSLPEKQAQEVQELIGLVWQKSIDFAEHGVGGSDYSYKPKLPAEFAEIAKVWVESGKPIKQWFAEMGAVVGNYEDYNLAEFEKAQE